MLEVVSPEKEDHELVRAFNAKGIKKTLFNDCLAVARKAAKGFSHSAVKWRVVIRGSNGEVKRLEVSL